MLELITEENLVLEYQQKFHDQITANLSNSERGIVGFQGGNLEQLIWHSKDFWYSEKVIDDSPVSRFWNAFGLQFDSSISNNIVVEINFPLEGIDRRVQGCIAVEKSTGNVLILHRGKVGGGRKGIGKENFKDWYNGEWVNVIEPDGNSNEAIPITFLGSDKLLHHLRQFVMQVSSFKEAITSGRNPRDFSSIDPSYDMSNYSPEFSGKKEYQRKKQQITATCNHGLVVDELKDFLETQFAPKSISFFNNQFIDLFADVEGDKMLFEIKASNNQQSLYTGIGQLLYHSKKVSCSNMTLVIPSHEEDKNIKTILSKMDIDLIQYDLVGSTAKFYLSNK